MFCIASQEEEKVGEGGSELVLGLMDVEPVEPELVVVELATGIVGTVIVRLVVGMVRERLGMAGLEGVLKSPDVLGHNITLDPGWRYTALLNVVRTIHTQ